jgi:holin-like protein
MDRGSGTQAPPRVVARGGAVTSTDEPPVVPPGVDAAPPGETSSPASRARGIAQVAFAVALLWGFAGLGDLVTRSAGLAIPGSVIGMLLLWIALETRIVRLPWVDRGAHLLLTALGLLFVPAGAGFVQFVGVGTAWLEVGAIVVAPDPRCHCAGRRPRAAQA